MSRYDEINNTIISMLEQGNIPWQKPWVGVLLGTFNVFSGRPYGFVNSCILSRQGAYGTFNNWKNLGGKIKKGAHHEVAYSWGHSEKEVVNEDGEIVKKTEWFLKPWYVFHIDDVEIDRSKIRTLKNREFNFESVKVADDLAEFYVNRENIKLNLEKGDRAFYRPSADSVTVPLKKQFKDSAEFYSTLFHELIHSTGTKERCDRVGERTAEAFFGNEEYSKEELVAELGAVGILNDLGIGTGKTIKNSAAYCQSWLKPLRNDKMFFFRAASRAEKAIKFLYGDFDFEEYHMDEPKAEKPKKTTKKAETKKTEEPKAVKPKKTTKKTTKKTDSGKTETKKSATKKSEPKKAEKVKADKPKIAKAETKKTEKSKKAEAKKTEKVKSDKPKAEKSATKKATKKTAAKAKAETAEVKSEGTKTAKPKAVRKSGKLTKAAKENIKNGYEYIVGGYKSAVENGEIVELPILPEIREDLFDGVTRNLYKDGEEKGGKAKELMARFTKPCIMAEINRLLVNDAEFFDAVA